MQNPRHKAGTSTQGTKRASVRRGRPATGNSGTDVFSPQKRSEIMRRVTGRNTTPELLVRRFLFGRGFRFRLHDPNLPGCPDIVLRRYKTVVFVHGCFWHQHPDCRKATIPQTRHDWWEAKLRRNVDRDRTVAKLLMEQGWRVVAVWECDTRNPDRLAVALEPLLAVTAAASSHSFRQAHA